MVIDTSALAAILFAEADGDRFYDAVARGGLLSLSSATLVEAGMVIEGRLGPPGAAGLREFLQTAEVSVVALDQPQALHALAAWRRFGKGRHPAALNLGDCFSYALAKATGEPLLFKGADFAQTDIAAVLV
jgi:ribonuclease VapC